ncbi:MAG TPA: RDD family protein [Acidimicrobiales bacterium]
MSSLMEPVDRVGVVSPEGVIFEAVLAGLGSRFVAAILDALLQGILIVALIFLATLTGGGDHAVAAAVAIVGAFLVLIGYHIAFETLRHGQTPGKRRAGLRVSSVRGGPVRFWPSTVRNVLRLIDILPWMYLAGAICILATKKNQRLGDFAASTIVVREPVPTRRGKKKERSTVVPALPSDHVLWDVSMINAEDLSIIRSFLSRRNDFVPDARARLATELATQYRLKVSGGSPDLSAEQFLEQLMTVKISRL